MLQLKCLMEPDGDNSGLKAARPLTLAASAERDSSELLSRSLQDSRVGVLKRQLDQIAHLQHEIDSFRKISSAAVAAGVKV